MKTTMYMYCLHDRAGLPGVPVPVATWMDSIRERGGLADCAEAVPRYWRALVAARLHPLWDQGRRLLSGESAVLGAWEPDVSFLFPLDGGLSLYVTEALWPDLDHEAEHFRTQDVPTEPVLSTRPHDAGFTRHVYRVRADAPIAAEGTPIGEDLRDAWDVGGIESYAAIQWLYTIALRAAGADPHWDLGRLDERRAVMLQDPDGAGLVYRLPLIDGPTFYVSGDRILLFHIQAERNGVEEHREVCVKA